MKSAGFLFLLAVGLQAAVIQPNLVLSNSQFSSQTSELPTGVFFGFEFGQPTYEGLTVSLPIGAGGRLNSNATAAQFIHALASVDFSIEGYRITRIALVGGLADDEGAAQYFGLTSPCSVVAASYNHSLGACNFADGLQSGTFNAYMNMRSDLERTFQTPNGGTAYYSDLGMIGAPRLRLDLAPVVEAAAVANPEPGSLALFGIGLALLAVKLSRQGYFRSF